MINKLFEPMAKTSSQVHTTTNYEKFKTLMGNRKTSEVHIKRLTNSFKVSYLFSPILINEKWEIIDGQHRFLAAKELNLPINYIIVEGYGLNEVQILNTNSANWKKEDYLKAYCDLGVTPYLQLREFMNHFPDFGIAVCEQLVTNNVGGSNNKNQMSKSHLKVKNFQEGRLSIPDLNQSYENAEKVMMFKPYYEGYNRSIFVAALIGIFKNENYNHAEMLSKLAQQQSCLTHCTNVTQYKLLIEEIYNFRRREKVNLRY
jgi:hypothetical protein